MATRKTGRHRRMPSGRWASVSTLPGVAAPTDPGRSPSGVSRRRTTRERSASQRSLGRSRHAGKRGNRLHANRRRTASSHDVPVIRGAAVRFMAGLRDRVSRGGAGQERSTWPKLLAVMLAVGALVLGGYSAYRFVTLSPYFSVRKVTFSPTEHISSEELSALAGLSPKDNVFSVDLAAIARRVASHPWISSAKARRRLPGEIHIDVVEQQPLAAVMMGGFYLINQAGELFKRAGYEEARALPLITGVSREEYMKRRERAKDRLEAALAAIRAYGDRKGRPLLGEVHVDDRGGVTLYSRRTGLQIRLGRGAFLTKLSRFDAVWIALGKRRRLLRVVRLDNQIRPERVTVRLADDLDGVVQAAPDGSDRETKPRTAAQPPRRRGPRRGKTAAAGGDATRPAGDLPLLVSRSRR